MGFSPPAAIDALIDRLLAGGFLENPATVGPDAAAAAFVDRGFSLTPGEGTPLGGRGKDDAPGLYWGESLIVSITHLLKPALKQRAWVEAYRDAHAAQRAINASDTPLTRSATVRLGKVSRRFLSSGAVLVQSFPVSIVFNLDLTPP